MPFVPHLQRCCTPPLFVWFPGSVFVRDRGERDPNKPADSSTPFGPLGHHMSCDFLVGPRIPEDMRSFRFTCRLEDLKYVMDKSYPLEPGTGRIRMLNSYNQFDDAAISRYDAATAPAFDTMEELLMNVKEINDLTTTGGIVAAASATRTAADARAQQLGIPVGAAKMAHYV